MGVPVLSGDFALCLKVFIQVQAQRPCRGFMYLASAQVLQAREMRQQPETCPCGLLEEGHFCVQQLFGRACVYRPSPLGTVPILIPRVPYLAGVSPEDWTQCGLCVSVPLLFHRG